MNMQRWEYASKNSPLERYGHNLTRLAQQGAFAPLAGEEAVIGRVFQILLRNTKNNPVLLDRDETRRWAIVAELVRRMAVGDAPAHLLKCQVIALDYEALCFDLLDDAFSCQERREQKIAPLIEKLSQAELESEEYWDLLNRLFLPPPLEEWIAPDLVLERLQSMFIAMHQAVDAYLLFVDPLHRLLGGEREKHPIDAAPLLKPVLARRQIQMIGACTLEQYRQHVERDAAMERRFQAIALAT
ncbi:MAG TPA: hypothetical protein VKR06_02260 [Ktedonosporobacter sp.]|nr:hypothetical protein [Ktedonosporobacter sp.]